MIMNISKNIRKTIGWCPDIKSNRVLIALSSDEEFPMGEKREGGMNPDKIGWGYKYRNSILLMSIASFVAFGLTLLIIKSFEETFALDFIIKGILIGILIAVLFMVFEWRRHNPKIQ